MRRHPALHPLSRGHQPILMHARDLRWRARYIDRGDAHLLPDAFEHFRRYADGGLEAHLRAEEDHLLPRLTACADGRLEAAIADDARLRRALRDAASTEVQESPAALRRLGDALEAHARHCERVLFPLAEETLDDAELDRVRDAVGVYQV